MEEVAFAWKNMKLVEKKIGDNFELVEIYLGHSTTGMEIELSFIDRILKSAYPKV